MSDAELADEREHILKAIKCVHARVPSQLSRFLFQVGSSPVARLRRAVLRCAVPSSAPPLGGSRRVRRLERHVWCIRRCLATVRRLKRGSSSDIGGGGADGDQPHGLCVEPAMARMLATLGGLDSSGVAC